MEASEALLLERVTILPERKIVSYFEHEFGGQSLIKAEQDIQELVEAGFSNVVLCVSETDMQSTERQAYLHNIVTLMNERGLEVWADPWGVGSVHGGEAVSHFKESGEKSCYCNPKLDTLVSGWIDTVSRLGINTIFWDEPEMKCDDHHGDELTYLSRYTARAFEFGIESVVCLCANEHKKGQLEMVAALPTVKEIATDPYYPNAFTRVPEEKRLDYVNSWVKHTKTVAEAYDKPFHVWVQLFDIPKGKESMIVEHIEVCRAAMADIALWGFHGCAAVPDFIKPSQAAPSRVWSTALEALRVHQEN